jgi:hypothetical protein
MNNCGVSSTSIGEASVDVAAGSIRSFMLGVASGLAMAAGVGETTTVGRGVGGDCGDGLSGAGVEDWIVEQAVSTRELQHIQAKKSFILIPSHRKYNCWLMRTY